MNFERAGGCFSFCNFFEENHGSGDARIVLHSGWENCVACEAVNINIEASFFHLLFLNKLSLLLSCCG